MIVLTASKLTKHYGPVPVLTGVDLEIRPSDKISLVGPNGAGKTTLLRILAGDEDPDGGTVERHRSIRVGVLEQQARFDPRRTVWQVAGEPLEGLRRLQREAEQLAAQISEAPAAERDTLGKRYDRLHHELQQRDAYHLDHKIQRVLEGLGFASESHQQAVGQLSGGQLNRLLMARLLLDEPDLMLLDEPSNHLDIDATQWLEEFLAAARSAILLVSHDRYFLDKVASQTVELFQGTLESYPGNFSAYRRQKAERLEVQRRTYARQQAEIAKLEDFVRRHHVGQKHAQAEDRRKKLERIQRVPPPREIALPPMRFPAAARSGDIVLRAENLCKAFDTPLFRNLTFDIQRGEKWGILGPNGCGKTTLLRCLLDLEPLDQGRTVRGTQVHVAYFDQQLATLDDQLAVIDAVRPDEREFDEQQRRDLLARFGITGDMVAQRVASLSGGERNRTALARLAASNANFLVLDEPTNHLDLWSRAALEQALNAFDGTLLFVTHDRYFLNQLADHLLVVQPDRFRVIEGNYDTYLHWIREGLAEPARRPADQRQAPAGKNTPQPPDSPRRRWRFPYRKVTEIEAEIAQREQRVEQLYEKLADPEVQRDGQRAKRLKEELDEQQTTLPQLYDHWEEAMERGI